MSDPAIGRRAFRAALHWLPLAVLFAVFFWLAYPPPEPADPAHFPIKLFPDSASYTTWGYGRPPVPFLFYSLVGSNAATPIAQTVLSLVCWLALGWVALGAPGAAVAGVLAGALPVVLWNKTILSESLALSFGAAFLAASLALGRHWSLPALPRVGRVPAALHRRAGRELLPRPADARGAPRLASPPLAGDRRRRRGDGGDVRGFQHRDRQAEPQLADPHDQPRPDADPSRRVPPRRVPGAGPARRAGAARRLGPDARGVRSGVRRSDAAVPAVARRAVASGLRRLAAHVGAASHLGRQDRHAR